MGSQADFEQSSTLKLPLFSMTSMDSPERSGMLTPPLHTSASVPFRWEEEPGKPKPCTALTTYSDLHSRLAHKCLELPPRLLLMDANGSKLSSPTTVLEGPYVGRPRFQGSSFRMSSECYGSFRRSLSPERDDQQLGALVLKRGHKERSVFGSLRRGALKSNKKEVGGGSCVFPSSVDRDSESSRDDEGSSGSCSNSTKSTSDKIKIKRAGSFSTLSAPVPKSQFWATVCGGLKQVVPWKNKKAKKDGLLS